MALSASDAAYRIIEAMTGMAREADAIVPDTVRSHPRLPAMASCGPARKIRMGAEAATTIFGCCGQANAIDIPPHWFEEGRNVTTKFRHSACALALLLLMQPALSSEADDTLRDAILAQDRALFAAFNTCNLEHWRRYLTEDVEFYQDNDQVTTTRAQLEPSFLDRCDDEGNAGLQRELIATSVEVHPIQGYGAVEIGSHRFWVMKDGKRSEVVSTPRFVHLWRSKGGQWQITRVISYGH